MKTLLGMFVLLAGTSAFAHDYTVNMTCAQTHQIVRDEGAVVLYTNEDIYDRYVTSGAFCMQGEYTEPAWVPTMDTSACFIGYTCENQSNHGG